MARYADTSSYTMDSHNSAVGAISSLISKFHARQEPFRIYHGSTNSTRQTIFDPSKMIDTSALTHCLHIDTQTKRALVEPNVPMDALVAFTLKYNLLPPVVPEFPGITVGGAFSGTGGESSSFRYGFFDKTITSIEIVLGSGTIVNASASENSDLFHGAASSFGTLGVTTLLEIQLIEAKSHVELNYIPITSISQAQREIAIALKDSSVDFVDGIIYSLHSGIICVGKLANFPPTSSSKPRIQTFSKATDPWFYLHAQTFLNHKIPAAEFIPIQDYLFRYDRAGFWVAKYAFKYFFTPLNRVTRYLLDYFMHTRVMYHALHRSGLDAQYVIQDVAIPSAKVEEFILWLEKNWGHYPIWLCPLVTDGSGHNPSNAKPEDQKENLEEQLLNIGVWGPSPHRTPVTPFSPSIFLNFNRLLETTVHSLGGQKWLYAHTYYTETEFNTIYPQEEYRALRKKYGAEYLPSVYEKVQVKERVATVGWWGLKGYLWERWPVRGVYGFLSAMKGGNYLLANGGRKKHKNNKYD